MKKAIALLMALLMCLSLSTFAMAEVEKTDLSVSIVVFGGFGDRSFYDSAKGGLDQLAADYGIETHTIECKEQQDQLAPSLIAASETSDFVVAVGWQFWDTLVEVVPQLPDTKFIFVDNPLPDIENLHAITYAENEGSFLVGYIAAKMSETGVVGAVGGEEGTTIKNFMTGYEQGATYANPDIKVEIIYAADFEDPAKGKECALALFDKGADIIFQVAGKTGEGVIEAAAETGHYAIGVDSDQKFINPDVVICSMIKEVGKSIYGTIETYIESGEFPGGEVWNADMQSGFISVGYGDETMAQQVSDELKAEVTALAEKIMSGEIEVETTR